MTWLQGQRELRAAHRALTCLPLSPEAPRPPWALFASSSSMSSGEMGLRWARATRSCLPQARGRRWSRGGPCLGSSLQARVPASRGPGPHVPPEVPGLDFSLVLLPS